MMKSENARRDLYAYMDWLGSLGFFVTLHTTVLPDPSYYRRNIHYHPFCLAIKTNRGAWNACIACQERLSRRCARGEDLFFETCHAGVSEYVLPLGEVDPAGFLCCSGYSPDPSLTRDRIRVFCADYGIGESRLFRLAEQTLLPEVPPRETVLAFLAPIRHLLMSATLDDPDVPEEPDGKTAVFARGRTEEKTYQALLSYLEGHCYEKTSLPALAEQFHCSESYLTRLFRKFHGQSISSYRSVLRLQSAEQFLIGTGYRIGEIAYRVGFGDANYFSDLFRRHYGLSPMQYRKENGRQQAPDR